VCSTIYTAPPLEDESLYLTNKFYFILAQESPSMTNTLHIQIDADQMEWLKEGRFVLCLGKPMADSIGDQSGEHITVSWAGGERVSWT
jgi:hypothetical protein